MAYSGTERRAFRLNRLARAVSFVLGVSYWRAKELLANTSEDVRRELAGSRRVKAVMESMSP